MFRSINGIPLICMLARSKIAHALARMDTEELQASQDDRGLSATLYQRKEEQA